MIRPETLWQGVIWHLRGGGPRNSRYTRKMALEHLFTVLTKEGIVENMGNGLFRFTKQARWILEPEEAATVDYLDELKGPTFQQDDDDDSPLDVSPEALFKKDGDFKKDGE